jgi:hypothetical protein
MTLYVEETLPVTVDSDAIWNVLKDFSSVQNYSLGVKSTQILGGPTAGLGCRRRCQFYDKTSVIEEITQYKEGEYFRMKLSEYSLPMQSLEAFLRVVPNGSGQSKVSMGIDYLPKGGAIGRVLGQYLMKPMLRKMLRKNLLGLAYYAKTKKVIVDQLPSANELKATIGI